MLIVDFHPSDSLVGLGERCIDCERATGGVRSLRKYLAGPELPPVNSGGPRERQTCPRQRVVRIGGNGDLIEFNRLEWLGTAEVSGADVVMPRFHVAAGRLD